MKIYIAWGNIKSISVFLSAIKFDILQNNISI